MKKTVQYPNMVKIIVPKSIPLEESFLHVLNHMSLCSQSQEAAFRIPHHNFSKSKKESVAELVNDVGGLFCEFPITRDAHTEAGLPTSGECFRCLRSSGWRDN